MEKDVKGKKGKVYSDERILEMMERRRDEIQALRKILAAFDKDKAKEKHTA